MLTLPRELLGWFTEPGDCEAVAAWLRQFPTPRLVVSLDMLCYGGLVASRSPEVPLKQAMERLDTLRELRRERADLIAFAFSLITRLGTTVTSTAQLEVHELLRAYSQLVDQAERLGDQGAQAELNSVLERLDPSVLGSYLEMRRRNHTVNRAAIQLVAEGVLDYLVLAQEDAAPVGIHMPEQRALRSQAEEFRVSDRVALHPGGDEAGMVLVARHCLSAAGRPVRIAADYATGAGGDLLPQFESQPLSHTVESQIVAAGGHPAAPGEAEAILFLHTPLGPQLDIAQGLAAAGEAPGLALQSESVVERLQAAGAAGRMVGLADVAYCNGADPELIAALARAGTARDLYAFAGWNTAANTIGTAVSQLCLQAARASEAGPSEQEAWRRMLASRFIDDYGYQSRVRQQAMAHAQSLGADPHALGEAWPELERYVNSELGPLARSIYSELLACGEEEPLGEVRASLPWHRLFEVEVELSS